MYEKKNRELKWKDFFEPMKVGLKKSFFDLIRNVSDEIGFKIGFFFVF